MCTQGNEKEIIRADGKRASCDACIHPIMQALNDAGLQTVASCCGHGKQTGNIMLKDGREILIMSNHGESRIVERLFPPLNKRVNEWRYTLRRKIARFVLTFYF